MQRKNLTSKVDMSMQKDKEDVPSKTPGKQKNYVLDTNVLLHDPVCFMNLYPGLLIKSVCLGFPDFDCAAVGS